MSLLSGKMESRVCLDGAGGGGLGEDGSGPDSPWNPAEGWEGVCRWGKNGQQGRYLLPFMDVAAGCGLHRGPARGRDCPPPTRPRRLIQRPKGAFIKTTPFCMFCITVAYPESKKTEAMKPAQGALSPRHRMSHCNCLQGLVLETCYNE